MTSSQLDMTASPAGFDQRRRSQDRWTTPRCRLTLSPAEIDAAVDYLAETRDGVAAALQGLSEAQWTFKPAPDRWSIAEIVEHLALLEELFLHKIAVRLTGGSTTAWTPDGDPRENDARVLACERDPSTKVVVRGRGSLGEAPGPLVPVGRWPPIESVRRWLEDRARTAIFVQSFPDLRWHVVDQPALGPLDGYQWVLFVAAHSERHTRQICEVKADPRFPRR